MNLDWLLCCSGGLSFPGHDPSIAKLEIAKLQITPMDPAHQLQQLYLAGFELQTFDRFPRSIGVIRDHCIALLVPGGGGLQMLGTPGWRMGEVMGLLVEKEGRPVFQAKSEIIEATPERLEALRRFRTDLHRFLSEEEASAGDDER